MAVTVKDLEKIRKEGLRALRETLGTVGMIKFLQMYSDGTGDYTKERQEKLGGVIKEDLQDYLREELN